MSTYNERLSKMMQAITRPPFKFPRKSNSYNNSAVSSPVLKSTTEPPLVIEKFEEDAVNYMVKASNNYMFEAAETIVNDTSIMLPTEDNSTISNYTYEIFNENLNETLSSANETIINTLTNDGYSNYNETLLEQLNNTTSLNNTTFLLNKNESTENTTFRPFDWIKDNGMDENNILLQMANKELARDDDSSYTLYVILGTMLGVLISLTVIMFLIYKAYKTRDNYSLQTLPRAQIKTTQFVADGPSQQQDEFDVVDFDDKDAYRF